MTMTTFRTLNPKVGDQVEIYLDKFGSVSPTKTITAVCGTIIGVYVDPNVFNDRWMIGWKSGQQRPRVVLPVAAVVPTTAPYIHLASDLSNYDTALWMLPNWECQASTQQLTNASNAMASAVGAGKANAAPVNVYQDFQFAQEEMKYPISQARQEKACRNSTCGRMNDLGVRKCWNCEVDNP